MRRATADGPQRGATGLCLRRAIDPSEVAMDEEVVFRGNVVRVTCPDCRRRMVIFVHINRKPPTQTACPSCATSMRLITSTSRPDRILATAGPLW